MGRLIPAGTGSVVKRLRRIASDRDKALAPVVPDPAAELPMITAYTEVSAAE